MKFLYGIIIAFSMYSKIPMPKIEWSKERMEYVMCFFPLVGVVLAVLTWASGILWFSLRPGDLLRAVVGEMCIRDRAEEAGLTKTTMILIGGAVAHADYDRSFLYHPEFTTEYREGKKE